MGTSKARGKSFPTMIETAILLMLFYPPFVKGLFFEVHMLITAISYGLAFIGYFVLLRKQNDHSPLFPAGIIEYGLVGLWAAYILSLFVAIRPSEALESIIRFTTYTIIFILVSRTINSENSLKRVLAVVFSTGLVLSLIGLAAYTGWKLEGALINNRISSTFQYPNTLATYLSVAFVIGVTLTQRAQNYYCQALWSGANMIILMAIFGTLSRGAFLVLIPALILYVVLQPKGERGFAFISSTVLFTLSAGLAFLLKDYRTNIAVAWVIILGGVIVGAALQYLIGLVLSALRGIENNSKTKKFYITGLTVFMMAVAATGIYSVSRTDVGAFKRLTSIGLTESSVIERGYYYSDAIKIIKDYPVFGTGGGGWASIYKQYRSIPYQTIEVHNFYLQTMVETGIPGILAIMVIIAGLVRAVIKLYQISDSAKKSAAAGIVTGIFILLANSALDVTLSFGASVILLYTLFGSVRALELMQSDNCDKDVTIGGVKNLLPVRKYGPVIAAVLLLIISTSVYIGLRYSAEAVDAMKKDSIPEQQRVLKIARAFDPLRPQYYTWLARSERLAAKGDSERVEQALRYAETAVYLDKTNVEYRLVKANILFMTKDVDKAIKEVENAVALDPWSQESYDVLTYMYTTVGKYYVKNGDVKTGQMYFRKALQVPKDMKKKGDELEKMEQWKALRSEVPLTLSESMKKNIQEIFHIMKDMGIAI